MNESSEFIDHTPTTAAQRVEHQPERARFYLSEEGHDVVVEYQQDTPGSVTFTRTFTPPELRGRGLARVVGERALAWARLNRLHVQASCSYIQHLLDEQAQASDG
jgi:hypothetical protein